MSMKSSLLDWKERAEMVTTKYTEASLQLESGPCLLVSVSISCYGSGEGAVALRDGTGASAPPAFYFSLPASRTHNQEFHPPVRFRQGLYVGFSGYISTMTVRYIPLKD